MDGLTISDSKTLLKTGGTASQIRNDKINQDAGVSTDSPSFAATLKQAVNSVNELSRESDIKIQKLATGKTKNVADVMIATEKASVAFKLLTQVRNKVIEAYREVMKMQV